MDTLGKKIKKLRNQKELSQRQLAKKLNIAPSTLAMYELDKREPDYVILKKIADFFAVSIDFLLSHNVKEESSHYFIYQNNKYRELPEKAKQEIKDYIDFIYKKYKKNNK